MGVKSFFKSKIRLPHKYVGNCPRCQSPMTGLYFKENGMNAYTIFSHMHYAGEFALPKHDLSDGLNCFCMNCDVSWSGTYETKWITLEEIEKIKKEKGITKKSVDSFRYFEKYQKEAYKEEKTSKKREKRQQRKEKRGKIL